MHWTQNPTLCHRGSNPARVDLRKGAKLASGSCFRESETLLGQPSSAPMRVCSGKQRVLVSPLGLCLHYGQGRSGLPPAPWAMVLCCWSLELETNSKRALLQEEGGWGLKRPCVHWPQHPTLCHLWRDSARDHLGKGTKLASGSCFHESETLLGKPSSAVMRVCSGKQCFLVSLQAIACHRYKVGLGFLLLPVHWCFAGGRWSWKPTPNVLYFRKKADGA